MEQALNHALRVVTFFAHGDQKTGLMKFFAEKKEDILQYLMGADGAGTAGVKWYLCVAVKYYKIEKNGETINQIAFHNSKSVDKLRRADIDTVLKQIHTAYNNMKEQHDDYQRRESGWQFDEVHYVKLCMGKYRPLAPSSYIPLPDRIKKNNAILNIQNTDNKCFLWSILAHLHPVGPNQHGYRVSKYEPYQHELNMENIPYPVKVKDIPKFEKQNHISVNVFGYEGGYYPLHISQEERLIHVNLLLVEKDGESHYCLIKDLDKMLFTQSNHHSKKFFCTHCLHAFSREDLLEDHKPYCQTHGIQHTKLPSENGKYMQFKNIAKMLQAPFVIYADFECLLKPTGLEGKKHHHEPCGYSYMIASTLPEHQYESVTYSGPNVLEHFFQEVMADGDYLYGVLKNKKPMKLSAEDLRYHSNTTICHICEGPVPLSDKVRDHCHLTGKYRGPAHSKCNLAYRKIDFIPVFFHNLEGYDSHLLMQQLGKYPEKKLSCISKNMEKYISFSLGNLRFLDSMSFMGGSLASLVNNLAAEGDQDFHHIKRHFPDPKHRNLLLRKGVYPYEWMDDESKMDHPSLPEKDAFYSSLSLQGITQEDYEHAQNVWNTFGMKTMRDYHDLYLKSDVLLLADVFEKFRQESLDNYGLDPAHYYTAPGLSWDAALKTTGVQLELLTDIDMHLMIEKAVRGGVSTITTRYCKANNPLVKDYDGDDKNHNYMMYLDANNLYGWAMSEPLPTHDFKWLDDLDIMPLYLDIGSVPADSPTGYVLEVDLEIPEELHDHFNHYPPAPEHMEITKDMLSPYNLRCLEDLGINHTPGTKLIPNLHNKEKYVLHYRALQCYLDLGLKLTKIHRVLSFQQSPWLKEYIDFNTNKRKDAVNAFQKMHYKLMNNAVYGKVSPSNFFLIPFN